MAWDSNLNESDRRRVGYALAQLRMAYDMRQIGDPKAQQYERAARQELCLLLDEEPDHMRGEK